jgi:hypothetical protein
LYHIILDTDMWIYLAEDFFPGTLSQLEELVDTGKITILIPEQVKNEWNNGKVEIVRNHYKNSINGVLSNTKKLKEFLNSEEKDTLSRLIESVERKKDDYGIVKANEYISRVEKLINNATICPITNENKIKATEMGLEKKAPFHKKKDSLGDALIVLRSVEYLVNHDIKNAFFITHNRTDFGEPGNDYFLHPDLKDLFDPVELQYSINVKEVFRLIDEMMVTAEEVQEVEKFNKAFAVPPILEDPKCPKCGITMNGAYLRSQYGGLTLQWFCPTGHYRMDTGEFWD